jgi:hypothetical protein
MTPEDRATMTPGERTEYERGHADGEIAVAHKAQEQFDEYEREIAALRAALAARDPRAQEAYDAGRLAGFEEGIAQAEQDALTTVREGLAARSEPRAEGLMTSVDPEAWDHIYYCQTCGKTRFVEWLHRDCPPDVWRGTRGDDATLAATPPAEGLDVNAAWAALLDCSDDAHGDSLAADIAHHRPIIDAAYRAATPPAEGHGPNDNCPCYQRGVHDGGIDGEDRA